MHSSLSNVLVPPPTNNKINQGHKCHSFKVYNMCYFCTEKVWYFIYPWNSFSALLRYFFHWHLYISFASPYPCTIFSRMGKKTDNRRQWANRKLQQQYKEGHLNAFPPSSSLHLNVKTVEETLHHESDLHCMQHKINKGICQSASKW